LNAKTCIERNVQSRHLFALLQIFSVLRLNLQMYIGNRLRKDEFLKTLDRSSRCELSVSECGLVYVCFYLPYPEFSSAKRLAAREHFSVQLYIIKLMLNEWLRGGVISGRSYPRYIIPAVNSGRLFIQEARRATVGSRFSPRHAIVLRRLYR